MDSLIAQFDKISLNKSIVVIQSLWRGYKVRSTQMPLILRFIQSQLRSINMKCSSEFDDGRINSCKDELEVIRLIQSKYPNRIEVPKMRMWYDVLLLDNVFGWIPVNIKTSTMKNHDNTGNLVMCLYSYTNEPMNIRKRYTNGSVHAILTKKIKQYELNRLYTRDYYFLVINKVDSSEILINSIRGLERLASNVNNLPFQIKWRANKEYQYKSVRESIDLFKVCIQKNKPSWKEQFVLAMNNIN